MNDFASFLRVKCHIAEKKIPFFLHWVAQYNEFASNSKRPDAPVVGVFLEKLSCKREDWQVRQAEKAVSLYDYYRKSLPLSKSDSIDRAPAEKLSDWQWAKDELVRQLRLRHRAFSTEKTYLGGRGVLAPIWTKARKKYPRGI